MVLPIASVPPDSGLQVIGTWLSRASTADAAKLTTAPADDVASTWNASGTVSSGGVVSLTVYSMRRVVALPAASMALTTIA